MSSAQLISADLKGSWAHWKEGSLMELGINLSINGQSCCNGEKGRVIRLSNTNPQNMTSLALLFSEPFVSLFLSRQQKPKHNQGSTTIKWLLITMNFEHQQGQKISSGSKRKCIFFSNCIDCTQPTKWSCYRIWQRSYMILQLQW